MNRTQWFDHYVADLSSHVNPLERFGKIATELNRTPLKDLPSQAKINEQVDGLIEAYRTVTNRKPNPKHLELLGDYCLLHYLKSQDPNKSEEASPILSHHQYERILKKEVCEFKEIQKVSPPMTPYFRRNPEILKLLEESEANESLLVLTGATLKQVRESCLVTQSDLSEAICISKNYLSAIERGVKPISKKQNVKLVDYFTSNQAISIKVLQFALSKLPQQKQGVITA